MKKLEIKLTDYETKLIKLYCLLFERYEKDSGHTIFHRGIVDLYVKFKKMVD